MSCGNQHDDSCNEVLSKIYFYLDRQLDAQTIAAIDRHLHDEECTPCLREYDLEERIRVLIQSDCGHLHAPERVRVQIMSSIKAIISD